MNVTFDCRFPCPADNTTSPDDGRADKRRYWHDCRANSLCLPGQRPLIIVPIDSHCNLPQNKTHS